MELKHQIVEKTKEVAEAKKEAEKAKKKAKKSAASKKTLTDAERRMDIKGLAREAGLMGPPVSTPAITAKASGQAKGRKDLGLPTMVTSRAPLDLGLSPDLGRVSAMLEEVPDSGQLADVFENLPAVDVVSNVPARVALVTTTYMTSLAGSASTTSIASTASEGQKGRRQKGGVKRSIGLEQSKEGSVGRETSTSQAAEGGRGKSARSPRLPL